MRGGVPAPVPPGRQPTPQPERDRGFEFKDVLSRSREAASSEPGGSEAKARLSFSVSRRGARSRGLAAGWERGPQRGAGSESGALLRPGGGCRPRPGECVLPANREDRVGERPPSSSAGWDTATGNTRWC